jgi:hypothetical protein
VAGPGRDRPEQEAGDFKYRRVCKTLGYPLALQLWVN